VTLRVFRSLAIAWSAKASAWPGVDLLALRVDHQAEEVRRPVARELHRLVGEEVDRARVVRREQRGDDRVLQARLRVRLVQRLDGDRAGVEVHHRAALVALAVLHVLGAARQARVLLAPGAARLAEERLLQLLVVLLEALQVAQQHARVALVARRPLLHHRPQRGFRVARGGERGGSAHRVHGAARGEQKDARPEEFQNQLLL